MNVKGGQGGSEAHRRFGENGKTMLSERGAG